MWKIEIYQTPDRKLPYQEWEDSLAPMILVRVLARIQRIKHGNFGDAKYIGDGVRELRLSFGSGYRIYFGLDDNTLVILLCAGDKSTQWKDIKNAKKFWKDYEKRKNG